jgi:hypothetical protein
VRIRDSWGVGFTAGGRTRWSGVSQKIDFACCSTISAR